jgi:hypothetical protein
MSLQTIDVCKVASELHEVLAKNEVPIRALDNIWEELKKQINMQTVIQKSDRNTVTILNYK